MSFIDVEPYIADKMKSTLFERLSERSRDDIELQLREVMKYLYLVSIAKESFIPLNKEADEVWHELILQTVSYADLCSRLPGGEFIHHESISLAGYADKVSDGKTVDQFLWWIPQYVQNFGEFTPEAAAYWTIVEFLQRELGLTLDEINTLGASSDV